MMQPVRSVRGPNTRLIFAFVRSAVVEFRVGDDRALRLVVVVAEVAVLVADDDEAVADVGGRQVRALEIGALELRTAQIGLRQVGFVEVAARHVGAEQVGARQLRLGEIRLAQISSDEFGLRKVAALEVHPLGNLEGQHEAHAACQAFGHLLVQADGVVDVVLAYFSAGRHVRVARSLFLGR